MTTTKRRGDPPVRYARPPGTIPYQDNARYRGAFGVESDSVPGKVYKVAFDTAAGYWVCSCPGGIHHGHCKHMERHGRPGRRTMESLAEAYEERQLPVPPVRVAFDAPPAYAKPLALPGSMEAAPRRRFALDGDV